MIKRMYTKSEKIKKCRPSGENIIKAELIINAFENYRMQSWFYRVLKFLKIR